MDFSVKLKQEDTVLIQHGSGTHFAKIMGKKFITRDGQALEGEGVDGVVVLDMMTFVIIRTMTDKD